MFEEVIPGNRVEETSQDNMRNEREWPRRKLIGLQAAQRAISPENAKHRETPDIQQGSPRIIAVQYRLDQ